MKIYIKFALATVLILAKFFASAIELQELIEKAKQSNNIVNLQRGRLYTVEKPLIFYDNLTINGNGAILCQSSSFGSRNPKYSSLLELVDVKNVVIKDIVIDHQIVTTTVPNLPSYSILLFGAENCHIEKVTFQNLGLPYDPKKVKGTPFILIISQNSENEFSYVPTYLSRHKASTINNRIENCIFKNTNLYSSFAIRVISNWNKGQALSDFKYRTERNVIYRNIFLGEYDWNTIEIAGIGSIYNVIKGNEINGRSISNIDIDKGASYNVIKSNIVRNSGLPERHSKRKDVRFAAISIHGSSESMINEGNQVLYNEIFDIENPKAGNLNSLYSSGIALLYTKNTIVKGNSISKLFDNKNYGVGILLDQSNDGIRLVNNKIRNTYRGIYESPNSRRNTNIHIENNDVGSKIDKVKMKTRKN